MNNNTKKIIAGLLTAASDRVRKSFDSYKPYRATLDHETALAEIQKAKEYLGKAEEQIIISINKQ